MNINFISINPSFFSQNFTLNFVLSPLQKQIATVAAVAIAALATCYFLYSCFQMKKGKAIRAENNDSKIAVKTEKKGENVPQSLSVSKENQVRSTEIKPVVKMREATKDAEPNTKDAFRIEPQPANSNELKQIDEDNAAPEEKAKRATISDWWDLERYCDDRWSQPGDTIDIPTDIGMGTYPKKMIHSVIRNRKYINWKDLNRLEEIVGTNFRQRLSGWIIAALSCDIPELKIQLEKARKEGTELKISLSFDQFESIGKYFYGKDSIDDIDIYKCYLGAHQAGWHPLAKNNSRWLNLNIPKWPYDRDHVTNAMTLYDVSKKHQDDNLTMACESYLIKALLTRGYHSIEFWHCINKSPDIAMLVFNGMAIHWKNRQDITSQTHLMLILDQLRQDAKKGQDSDYVNFVCLVLQQIARYSETNFHKEINSQLNPLFDSLDEKQIEELAKLMIKNLIQPGEALGVLIEFGLTSEHDSTEGKRKRILSAAASLMDQPKELHKIFIANTYAMNVYFFGQLDDEKIKALIKYWTLVNEPRLFNYLSAIHDAHRLTQEIKQLCEAEGIGYLDKIINTKT